MVSLINQHYDLILVILGILALFFGTLIVMGFQARREAARPSVPPANRRHPTSPSGQRSRLVDVRVYETTGKSSPEVAVQFYTEEKFATSAIIMEALYQILKEEDYYDYETFENFTDSIQNFVTFRDFSKRRIAKELRASIKKRK